MSYVRTPEHRARMSALKTGLPNIGRGRLTHGHAKTKLSSTYYSWANMIQRLAMLATLLTMAARLAYAEPWYGDGMAAEPWPLKPATEGDCIWTFVDATPLRDGTMPQHGSVTLETRQKLCFYGLTYALTTWQRIVQDDGKIVFPWHIKVMEFDGLTESLWLATEKGKPPQWGKFAFPDSEKLPK